MARPFKFEIRYSVPKPKQTSYVFEELYEEYYDFFFRAAYSYTKHWHDAEEVAQEIFLRVLCRWHTIKFTHLSQCLSRIASQAHMDWFRIYKREGADIRSYDMMFLPEADYNHPESQESDPLLIMLRDEAGDCMREHLQCLKPLDAKLFYMVYVEGIKTTESAKIIGISKGNADVRLFRIRKKLATCLTKEQIWG